MPKRVAVTTGNTLEGYEVAEYLGIVRGIVVRAQTLSQGIRAAFSQILGGNIKAYEEVCEYARSAELLVLADVKRGDIGSTTRAYAAAYLEPRNGDGPLADAISE